MGFSLSENIGLAIPQFIRWRKKNRFRAKSRILVIDDMENVRNVIKHMLTTQGYDVLTAKNGRDGYYKYHEDAGNIGLIISDIDMPIMNGVTATQKAVQKYPKIKILGLSMFGDEKFYAKMLKAGAKGFMLKKSGMSELIKGIKDVAEGESYFSSELLRNIVINIQQFDGKKIAGNNEERISEREHEVLQSLANGLSAKIWDLRSQIFKVQVSG